jgi:uncharacterized protein (DUF2141 family)
MFNKQLSYAIVFALALIGCAKQSTPTGGPKDTIPPILDAGASFPKHNQVNVNPKTIQLVFDEHIILNNPKDQILIVPDIDKKYEISAKKKNVTITLNDALAPNTTYSINFRDAVQDITEKNPAENLKLAFSTGTYIDSLIIRGQVVSSADNKPVKDATVALYQSDTFNIFRHKPTYITKTNEKGLYQIENLKPGTYYLYGIVDKNKNLLADSRNESYGFKVTPLTLSQNVTADTIDLIKLDTRPLKLTSARPYNTYYNIKFSKGVKTYTITTPTGNPPPNILTADHSTLKVYDNTDQDSTLIQLQAIDSADHKLDTTLYYKFLPKKPMAEKFTIRHDQWRVNSSTGIIEGNVYYDKPISRITFDSIGYAMDSLNVIKFDSTNLTHNPVTKHILFRKTIPLDLFPKPSTTPRTTSRKSTTSNSVLSFGKGAFISIEQDSSQETQQQLKPLTNEETATLLVNVQTNQQSFIVQVLNKNLLEVASARNKRSNQFTHLPPGDYQIRLIIDKNQDGAWTPGNILLKRDTEPIRYYQNDKKIPLVTLKANWEVGPLLITY